MSTLITSNISDGTTSVGTGYVVNGSAKAWLAVNAAGGSPTISDSLNVTSVTDDATGQRTVNLTNAFASTAYSMAGCTIDQAASGLSGMENSNSSSVFGTASAPKTSYRVSSGTYIDCDNQHAQMFGDLA